MMTLLRGSGSVAAIIYVIAFAAGLPSSSYALPPARTADELANGNWKLSFQDGSKSYAHEYSDMQATLEAFLKEPCVPAEFIDLWSKRGDKLATEMYNNALRGEHALFNDNEYVHYATQYLWDLVYKLKNYKRCGDGSSRAGIAPDTVFYVSAEVGGAAGAASYDEVHYNTNGFFGGASVGARWYEPSGTTFFGTQISVLGGHNFGRTDLPGTSSELQGTLRWMVPVDVQLGMTTRAPFLPSPITVYAFVGPTWGLKNVQIGTAPSENFTLFGVSAGLGIDYSVSSNWTVGAKVRAYSLGPSDERSQGLQVQGVIGTATVSYRFH